MHLVAIFSSAILICLWRLFKYDYFTSIYYKQTPTAKLFEIANETNEKKNERGICKRFTIITATNTHFWRAHHDIIFPPFL